MPKVLRSNARARKPVKKPRPKRATVGLALREVRPKMVQSQADHRALLKLLVGVINKSSSSQYSAALRDIVTAFRGPDDADFEVKLKYTVPIRVLAGIKRGSQLAANLMKPVDLPSLYYPDKPSVSSGHFTSHIARAIRGLETLGLAEHFNDLPNELLPTR